MKYSFKHLILALIVLFMIILFKDIIYLLLNKKEITFIFWISKINTFIFSSGVDVNFLESNIPAIGILWFLTALFIGRTIFDYLQSKFKDVTLLFIVLLLSIFDVIIGQIQWLPFSLDIVFAIQFFFYFGNYLKKLEFNKMAFIRCFICFCVWIISLMFINMVTDSYLESACRRYTLFPLCYVIAIFGTMFILYFSVLLSKYLKIFAFLGKNSMYILWVHILKSSFSISFSFTSNIFVNGINRIIFNILLFLLFYYFFYLIKKKKYIY